MKLSRFISSLLLAILPAAAFACGAFQSATSNPFVFHFYQEEDEPTLAKAQRAENIALWQEMTSKSIPYADVKYAVYDITLEELKNAFDSGKSGNGLLDWIVSHKANDLKEFLLLAKELEELRAHRASAWYYPADKNEPCGSKGEAEQFARILEQCRQHAAGELSDRYGVQYIRALMALVRHQECIDFYDERMSALPDSSLMKRMAKGYVAGCHLRVGNRDIANRMFAEVGDFNSITGGIESHFTALVRNNPESDVIKSRLNHWIGYGDRIDNIAFLDIADAALSSPHIANRGDWLYLKAYIEETYNKNHSKALHYATKALDASFSKEEMRRDAMIMRLCLEAENGNLRVDLTDYIDAFQTTSNPFFFYIVPALLKNGRVSEALLLANYASHLHDVLNQEDENYYPYFHTYVNNSDTQFCIDNNAYATTGFQLMLSQSPQAMIAYKEFLESDRDIVKKCIGGIRHDDDYLNEIIGTLFLREGNYPEAEKYFMQVSEDYQQQLNIKKCGYLLDNPWANCYMPADKWAYPSSKGESMDVEASLVASFYPANSRLLESDENAKLNFAREMSRLEEIMKSGTPDQRGLARIRHALARYNSFYNCWALTQYWLGDANQCNYQPFYWLWDYDYKELDYLKELTGQIPDQKWVDAQVQIGMNELQSAEALAEAQFLIGNYKTIAKKYPNSPAGKFLSSHCDSWANWL